MTDRPTIAHAVTVFERLLADAGRTAGDLTADVALQMFGAFAAERFATGSQPDADGLLYQYGISAFTGHDMFYLDLTRQFETVDSAGYHADYVQLHCALHFPPDPELRALGHHNQWWFHDSGDEALHLWLRALRMRPEWALLRGRRPSSVDICSETV